MIIYTIYNPKEGIINFLEADIRNIIDFETSIYHTFHEIGKPTNADVASHTFSGKIIYNNILGCHPTYDDFTVKEHLEAKEYWASLGMDEDNNDMFSDSHVLASKKLDTNEAWDLWKNWGYTNNPFTYKTRLPDDEIEIYRWLIITNDNGFILANDIVRMEINDNDVQTGLIIDASDPHYHHYTDGTEPIGLNNLVDDWSKIIPLLK